MSYLLDALKQSEAHDKGASPAYNSATGTHYHQHQDLRFYRRLSIALVSLFILLLTLAVGFMAGKWVQNVESNNNIVSVTKPEITPEKSVTQKQQDLPQVTQPGTIQSPIVQVQPQGNFIQPVMQAANGIQYQLVPVQPNIQAQIQPNTAIDYSQYKVVGKPVEDSPKQEKIDETAHLSSTLKAAFANAVAATENHDDYEVVKTTKDSAMAQPIELLPDLIQAMIPAMQYQAHIYATQSDKRWIKINDKDLYEGEWLQNVQVVEITPELTLMDVDGYRFSLQAMSDWQP